IGSDKLAQEAHDALGGRVAVTHDGPHLFVYADSEEQARAAQAALSPLLAEHGVEGDAVVLQRWPPEEEHWEAPSVAMPEDAPEDTELIVEPNGQEVWREMHPYAVLGGLGN